MSTTGSGYTALTGLSSLRELTLDSCEHLPACLSQLTGLADLTIDDREGLIQDADAAGAAIVQAVGQLTNLDCLIVIDVRSEGLERTFPSLSRLRSLYWVALDLPAGVALPAGGWLANLQLLGMPIRLLHNSLAALDSARQLQTLALSVEEGSELLPRLLRWVARRPVLEQLMLGISPEELYRHLGAILELQRCMPHLRITAARNINV